MPPTSAGILLYRRHRGALEVLLVHFGGPFWARRDAGAWSIPKGIVEPGEDAADAARREFAEELGSPPPPEIQPLATIRQAGGKRVVAFAAHGEFAPAALASTDFTVEWPRGSGQRRSYPEVDRAAWYGMAEARNAMLPSQLPLLEALEAMLGRE